MRRRIKNIVKTITRFIYHSEWQSRYIKGVDPNNPKDEWTTNIHMNNLYMGSCGPISAAMILYWHDKIHYGAKNFEMLTSKVATNGKDEVSFVGLDAADPIAFYEGHDEYKHSCTTLEDCEGCEFYEDNRSRIEWIHEIGVGGMKQWELDHKITHAIERIGGFTGYAEWDWSTSNVAWDWATGIAALVSPIGGINLLNNRRMFNDFKSDVKNDQPGIIGMYGKYRSNEIGGHFMPVIGYKLKAREVFNIDTVIFDECYVYTDTNWSEGKRFWRIDVWSKIDSVLGRIKVRVWDGEPHYHWKKRKVWKWKKLRYVTKTETWYCNIINCTAPNRMEVE